MRVKIFKADDCRFCLKVLKELERHLGPENRVHKQVGYESTEIILLVLVTILRNY